MIHHRTRRYAPRRGAEATDPEREAHPHLFLLHAGMLLSGFGTAFLGPVLPALARSAHVTDSGSGLFFTAQFLGAFAGGVTTSRRLWLSLIRGCAAATVGFILLAFCTSRQLSLSLTACSLLPMGFGVGQMLTSLNLLTSRRFRHGRGAALSLVNFSWSLGAVTAPFLLGNLLQRASLSHIVFAVAVAFAGALLLALLGAPGDWLRHGGREDEGAGPGVGAGAFAYFALLLLVYGGVETSLGGWVTTFGTRYGSGRIGSSALNESALWLGIVAGRALSASLLRHVGERRLLPLSLLAATVFAALLSQANGGPSILLLAMLLGLALAPWFPLVLTGMLGEGATATQVGSIIAVSGLGAAALPALVGAVSRAAGSLRVGLVVPLAGLLVLLALAFRTPGSPASKASLPEQGESV